MGFMYCRGIAKGALPDRIFHEWSNTKGVWESEITCTLFVALRFVRVGLSENIITSFWGTPQVPHMHWLATFAHEDVLKHW